MKEFIRQTLLKHMAITPYKLSKESGISQSQISRFLNRGKALSVESAVKLIHASGMEVEVRIMKDGKTLESQKLQKQ